MATTLPDHVTAILEGDFGVAECFEIMRAARIKAEHVFNEQAPGTDKALAAAISDLFAPLNALTDELEVTLRKAQHSLAENSQS